MSSSVISGLLTGGLAYLNPLSLIKPHGLPVVMNDVAYLVIVVLIGFVASRRWYAARADKLRGVIYLYDPLPASNKADAISGIGLRILSIVLTATIGIVAILVQVLSAKGIIKP